MKEIKNTPIEYKASIGKEVKVFIKENVYGIEVKKQIEKEVK